jgi:hypothetical protein
MKPHRTLEEDLKLTDQTMSYDGSANRRATSVPPAQTINRRSAMVDQPSTAAKQPSPVTDWPKRSDGSPDFASMTSEHRRAYDAWRLTRKFG